METIIILYEVFKRQIISIVDKQLRRDFLKRETKPLIKGNPDKINSIKAEINKSQKSVNGKL